MSRRHLPASFFRYHIMSSLMSATFCLMCVSSVGAETFPEGAKAVFMGHSFFKPMTIKFDDFATFSGSYPDHEWDTFFRGGDGGSPLNLWDNHKDDIESLFSSETELFGMTFAAGDANLTEQEWINGYQQWFDLAIGYNPNMSFFLGLPWPDFPEDYTADEYEARNREDSATLFDILVNELRILYPDNDITFLNYGSVAVEARHILEDPMDELVGIEAMRCQFGNICLFVDLKGHAGDMIIELSALAWMKVLYDTPTNAIISGATQQLGYDRGNVIDIFNAVLESNESWQL